MPFGPFLASLRLTQAGDVTFVPVPGHTPGQLAVVVEEEDHAVFLAGDSSYTEAALLRGAVDGVGADEAAERLTHERIRAYARQTPTVYLPAHDPRDGSPPRRAPADRGPAGRGARVISFETSVRIERPIQEVFAFVSDPLRFPLWNVAVQAVRRISGEAGKTGSTYSMERELGAGRVENLEVFARRQSSELGIRTTRGPTPFVYSYRFAADGTGTIVHLEAQVELPGVAAVLGPVAARGVRRGVDANFAPLQRALEESAET